MKFILIIPDLRQQDHAEAGILLDIVVAIPGHLHSDRGYVPLAHEQDP